MFADPAAGITQSPKVKLAYAESHASVGNCQAASQELDAAITSYEAAVAILEPIGKPPGAEAQVKDRYRKYRKTLEELKAAKAGRAAA